MDEDTARVGARDSVTGRKTFAGDFLLPGTGHVALIRSPYPHARVKSIDGSEAIAAGALAVVTGDDLALPTYGRRVRDVPVLARGVARFAGERVAAVVAESKELAREVAALVRVEYEPLEAATVASDALVPGSPLVHEAPWAYPGAVITAEDGHNLQSSAIWRNGPDVESVLASSTRTFQASYQVPSRHQGYLEAHVCLVSAEPEAIDVWASNKSPSILREQLVAWLESDTVPIRIHPVAVGGDFGGKGSPMDVPLCIALSRRLGQPVRIEASYGEELTATNPSHSATTCVRLGVDDDNRLTALDVDIVLDGGAYAGFKPNPQVQLFNLRLAGATYRIPALQIRSRIAYSHTVPRGHVRAPGAQQVTFAVESLLDEVARELELDPFEFRRINLLHTGQPGNLGEQWLEMRADETLTAAQGALSEVNPPSRREAGEEWAAGAGVAMFCQQVHSGAAEVALEPTTEGRLTIWVPFPDQGGGQQTVAERVVRTELGIPRELVTVRQAEQSELKRDFGVGASRVTVDASEALIVACRELRTELGETHTQIGSRDGRGSSGATDRVEFSAREWSEVLSALALRNPGHWFLGRADHRDKQPLISVCTQVATVLVDRETGEVIVNELITAADVAEVINEAGHLGQIEGAAVMGLGQAMMEDLAIVDGLVAASQLGKYLLPSVRDTPKQVVVMVRGGKGLGERNVKPIGELAGVAVAPAIGNAIADAVGARIRSLPLTSEKVYFAMQRGVSGGSNAPPAVEGQVPGSEAGGDGP
ncbi:MAG: xanthine dehydrogenase family protein molybdopterin-binding subunit [Trueperaceae bacterium]